MQIQLDIDETPRKWYNAMSDLPDLVDRSVTDPEQMEIYKRIRPKEVVRHEFSKKSWIRIPDELRELYLHAGRPYALYRAKRLEQILKTPARIYYKREDSSPTGAFKINTALAVCYYAMKEGGARVVTETGAGQWGTSLCFAANLLGLKSAVYMVRHPFKLKPERRSLMKMYRGDVYASPSKMTDIGKKYLQENPEHPGTIGIAKAEAIADALKHENNTAPTGSTENHTLIYCSIIGLEAKKQLEQEEEEGPNVIAACTGGGSVLGGLSLPFLKDILDKKLECKIVACETASAPSFTQGKYEYAYQDPLKNTPPLKMYSVGVENPLLPPIYAEGLRYHGKSPILSYLKDKGVLNAVAYPSDEKAVFEALRTFVMAEGFLPAPESGYGIKYVIDEALRAKKEKEEKVLLTVLSGHGWLDFPGYNASLGLTNS